MKSKYKYLPKSHRVVHHCDLQPRIELLSLALQSSHAQINQLSINLESIQARHDQDRKEANEQIEQLTIRHDQDRKEANEQIEFLSLELENYQEQSYMQIEHLTSELENY